MLIADCYLIFFHVKVVLNPFPQADDVLGVIYIDLDVFVQSIDLRGSSAFVV